MTVDEVRKARMVCNRCPVQLECLEWAITRREEFGIWGGSTSRQRRKWLRDFDAQTLEVNSISVQDDTEPTPEQLAEVHELYPDLNSDTPEDVFDSEQSFENDYPYRVAAVR